MGKAEFNDVNGGVTFNSAEFKKIFFSNIRFTKISLNGTDFEEMHVNWNSLKHVLDYNSFVYTKLIKNFRSLEQFDDADDVFYEYKEQRRINDGGLWNYLLWITCGYGVRPLRAIAVGLVVMLIIFPIIYLLMGISLINAFEISCVSFISGYNHQFVGSELTNPIESMKRWLSTHDRIFKFCMNLKRRLNRDWIIKLIMNLKRIANPTKLVMFFMIVESIVGWLILGLFIVTLVNVIIRP